MRQDRLREAQATVAFQKSCKGTCWQIQRDDETTAYQLYQMLLEHGVDISLRTILRLRTVFGWTFCGSAYCQLIRETNKSRLLEWCEQYNDDNFDDVIWTDESTIQLEAYQRSCCRKLGQAPRAKPR